jgi:D-cysteine desulfhydrase
METKNIKYPYLFETYPKLHKIPWISLINSPTPVEKLVGLEKEMEFNGIYIKRDDLTNPTYGGNKPRKFEFLLGHALKKKKKHILTIGGIGSNHCVANSMFCKKLGLTSSIFLKRQPLTGHVRNNMLKYLYFGSKITHKKTEIGLISAILWYIATHWRSYFIWAGGSNKIGAVGFVNAALELKHQIEQNQIPEPDYIFAATGSSGTSAGLTLGCELAGLKTKIKAIQVSDQRFVSKSVILKLAKKSNKHLRKFDSSVPDISIEQLEQRLEVDSRYFGGSYGITTDKGKQAVELIKKSDGICLETVYTGKALSGLIDFIQTHRDSLEGKNLLFWNTFSSVDHSKEINEMDYHNLPKNLHKYFDGAIPLSSKIIKV